MVPMMENNIGDHQQQHGRGGPPRLLGKVEWICDEARAGELEVWMDNEPHVDLVDLDIQGAERELVPRLLPTLERKVYRLLIGTHHRAAHAQLLRLLRDERGWIAWESRKGTRSEESY